MYLDGRMNGFHDELSKISHELTQGERTDFAQPNKSEEGHKGKYPIPDKKHFAIAKGFAKMHHDEGALHAIEAKGKKMGYEEKDSCMKTASYNVYQTVMQARVASR